MNSTQSRSCLPPAALLVCALLLGVIYTIRTQDAQNGLSDSTFLSPQLLEEISVAVDSTIAVVAPSLNTKISSLELLENGRLGFPGRIVHLQLAGGGGALYSLYNKDIVRIVLPHSYGGEISEVNASMTPEQSMRKGEELLKVLGVPFKFADGVTFETSEEHHRYDRGSGTWNIGGNYFLDSVPTRVFAYVRIVDRTSELVRFEHLLPESVEHNVQKIPKESAIKKATRLVLSEFSTNPVMTKCELMYAYPSNVWSTWFFSRRKLELDLRLAWVITFDQQPDSPGMHGIDFPPIVVHVDATSGRVTGGGGG